MQDELTPANRGLQNFQLQESTGTAGRLGERYTRLHVWLVTLRLPSGATVGSQHSIMQTVEMWMQVWKKRGRTGMNRAASDAAEAELSDMTNMTATRAATFTMGNALELSFRSAWPVRPTHWWWPACTVCLPMSWVPVPPVPA